MSNPNFLDSNQSPFKSPASPYVQQSPSGEPAGIGGWLVLLAIGLVIAPIRTAISVLVVYVPIFSDGTWETLTDPSSPTYNALWAPIIFFEVCTNVSFVVAYVFLAILFFRKSRWFPTVYMTLALLNIGFTLLDTWLISLVMIDEPMFDPETSRELFRSVLALVIWGPYLLTSRRAKNTFVR